MGSGGRGYTGEASAALTILYYWLLGLTHNKGSGGAQTYRSLYSYKLKRIHTSPADCCRGSWRCEYRSCVHFKRSRLDLDIGHTTRFLDTLRDSKVLRTHFQTHKLHRNTS